LEQHYWSVDVRECLFLEMAHLLDIVP
jgi:hypothetical protein